MRVRLLAALAIVCSTAVVGGCSQAGDVPAVSAAQHASNSPGQAPSQVWDDSNGPDPCRALTAGEVSAAVGEAVNSPDPRIGEHPYCSFKFAQRDEFLFVAEDSSLTALNDFQGETADRGNAQPVPGLGRQAFWNVHSDGASLQVMIGKTHLEVKFGGGRTPKAAREAAISLMRTVIARLRPANGRP